MQAGLLWCYRSVQGKEAAGEETNGQKKIAGKLHSSTLADSIPLWQRAAVVKSSRGSGCLLCTRALCVIRTPCMGFSGSLYYLFRCASPPRMSILKGLCGALELQGLAQRVAGGSCVLESVPFSKGIYFILTQYRLFLALISPIRSGWKVQRGP